MPSSNVWRWGSASLLFLPPQSGASHASCISIQVAVGLEEASSIWSTANESVLRDSRRHRHWLWQKAEAHLCISSWINPATDPPQLATIVIIHLNHWRNPAFLGSSLLAFLGPRGVCRKRKETKINRDSKDTRQVGLAPPSPLKLVYSTPYPVALERLPALLF